MLPEGGPSIADRKQFEQINNFIIANHRIQMHKHKYYKPPKPSTLPQKPIDLNARPQFVTDFSDPDKYKLSECEMIQKKAALQSKNREAARHSLEERKRKLEMGIVDEDTRKIYQTALTSKRIDLNPSIRRNLSQMIQYERQRSANKNGRVSATKNRTSTSKAQNSQQQEEAQGFETQIKKTQHFIKKLEKAKKQQNIGKAYDILLDEKKSPNFGPAKSTSLQQEADRSQRYGQEDGTHIPNVSRVSEKSQEQALWNIEETIKFMEEKLFNPNWKNIKAGTHSVCTNKEQTQKKIENEYKMEDIKQSTISEISYNQFMLSFPQDRQCRSPAVLQLGSPGSNHLKAKEEDQEESFDMEAQLAALRLNFNMNTAINSVDANGASHRKPVVELEEDEDECLETIRRMKDIMESKACLFDNSECGRQKENKNRFNQNYQTQRSHHTFKSEGDAEVDFSLTLNEDEIQMHNLAVPSISNSRTHADIRRQSLLKEDYEQLKKSLFEQIDKLKDSNMVRQEEESEEESPYDAPVQYQYGREPNKPHKVQQGKNSLNFRRKQNTHLPREQAIEEELSKGVNAESRQTGGNSNAQVSVTAASKQLEQLKSIVQVAKQNASNISVQKIGLEQGTGMRGFDYRGSINIKKHVMMQP